MDARPAGIGRVEGRAPADGSLGDAPRTSYALTCGGRDLQQVIDAIHPWGKAHLTDLREAQRHTVAEA